MLGWSSLGQENKDFFLNWYKADEVGAICHTTLCDFNSAKISENLGETAISPISHEVTPPVAHLFAEIYVPNLVYLLNNSPLLWIISLSVQGCGV